MKKIDVDQDFRGFLYTPSYENEVVVLFGMLLQDLDNRYVIDQYWGSFPDCLARRDGEQIGIEFEVNSTDFTKHKHDQKPNLHRCKLIVCWENGWKTNKKQFRGHEIEILELKEAIKQKGLSLIHLNKPKYEERRIWDEKSFFAELRKNVDDTVFDRMMQIYGICRSCQQFEVSPGEGAKKASIRVGIIRWQEKNIGDPHPIQLYADGTVVVVYKGLPKELEEELRRRTGQPKGAWPSHHMKQEETFNNIKKMLEWIAEVSK